MIGHYAAGLMAHLNQPKLWHFFLVLRRVMNQTSLLQTKKMDTHACVLGAIVILPSFGQHPLPQLHPAPVQYHIQPSFKCLPMLVLWLDDLSERLSTPTADHGVYLNHQMLSTFPVTTPRPRTKHSLKALVYQVVPSHLPRGVDGAIPIRPLQLAPAAVSF